MDPDEAVKMIRKTIRDLTRELDHAADSKTGFTRTEDLVDVLINQWNGLDNWLSAGSFLPDTWGRKDEPMPVCEDSTDEPQPLWKDGTGPGTVIHGTLRPEDLVPAFIGVLELVDLDSLRKIVGTYGYFIEVLTSGDKQRINDLDCGEEVSWLIEELVDAIDRSAPEGYCFGGNEGDGADFGFWKCDSDDDNDDDDDAEIETDQ